MFYGIKLNFSSYNLFILLLQLLAQDTSNKTARNNIILFRCQVCITMQSLHY